VCLARKSNQQNLVSELGSKKYFGQKFEDKEENKVEGEAMANTSRNVNWSNVQVPIFSSENYDF
jgi:hypothetical protein